MNTELEVLTDILIHIDEVRENLEEMIHDLRLRGIKHDRSKLQEPEFSIFVSTRPKFKKVNYGTKEYEEVSKEAYEAVRHHYDHNRHHVKHHVEGIYDMNLLDMLEMLADWKAAARRSPDLSFKDSLPRAFKKYGFDETLQCIFMNTLEYLGWI